MFISSIRHIQIPLRFALLPFYKGGIEGGFVRVSSTICHFSQTLRFGSHKDQYGQPVRSSIAHAMFCARGRESGAARTDFSSFLTDTDLPAALQHVIHFVRPFMGV